MIHNVPTQERNTSIDVLRGVAVLGILYMNIQTFAMIDAAYINPTAYGDLTGANFAVWFVGRLLFDGKFIALFSALFGAGIVMMAERRTEAGHSPAGLHYRRMFWLMVIGVLHAYLLWHGDVLFAYALLGMVFYPCWRLRPGKLLVLGVILMSIGGGIYLYTGWSMPHWPESIRQELHETTWAPDPAATAEILEAYRGGWFDQMRHRVPSALNMHLFMLPYHFLWRIGGLMLTGMALYKWGVFTARRTPREYGLLVAFGALLGFPITLWGIHLESSVAWSSIYAMFVYGVPVYAGSWIILLGYTGVVMLVCQRFGESGALRPFAAVGRMAFTNYLMQTVICTTLFYGHGFGWFGHVERTGQVAIMAAVWAFQLVISVMWMGRFRFGPMEWLWRSLTYGAWQPMRK